MAKSKKDSRKNTIDPKISILDNAAKKLLTTIDTGYSERELLSEKDSKIQSILSSELDLAKGISNGSIIDFVTTMNKENAKKNGQNPDEVDSSDLFTKDVGNIFGYYQDLYKNRYIEMTDLKFITKFIPAIGEAVKTTLDSIVASDDFSTSISRNLVFGSALTDEEKASAQAEIERIEKEEKLLKRLRNIVYNKTLVSGNHYVYCIPYNELFAEYDRLVKSGKINNGMATNSSFAAASNQNKMNTEKGFNLKGQGFLANESFTNSFIALEKSSEYSSIIESLTEDISSNYFDKKDSSKIKNEITECFSKVFTFDSDVLYEALEGYGNSELMKNNIASYRETFGGNAVLDNVSELNDKMYSEGSNTPEKFHTTGSYLQFIEASKMIPIKVYNQIIGYFHVHNMSTAKKAMAATTTANQTNMLTGSATSIFSSASLTDEKRENAVRTIVNGISDGILANFSNKFVNKNVEFKKLIADCIIANGFVNSAFQIQFIPAKYVIPFAVNEDENGIGQSILQDALFPAKMLLSLLVSKLLLYMNKSGNKTIAYVRKGPIDVSTSNHVQRTIRMLQESNITFSDLLSTNLSFAKFNRNGNIQLPMARNGDRLIDFETQEGQEVDLRTPMEEYLEKLAIMGTGVPSVILEYTDAADYAKSLVTANLKFAGRIATMQADLEEPTTDLYIELIKTSQLDENIKNKLIQSFEFKLCRPRVLTNANMADYLGQIDSVTTSLARLYLGDSDENPEDAKVRQLFIRKLSMNMLPFVDWDEYDDILKASKVETAKEIDLDKSNNSDGGDASTDDEFL